MTTLRKAAQQALEALEYVLKPTTDFDEDVCQKLHDKAIAALRAALAEPPTNQCGETCERAKLCAVCARELEGPVQEPVAWTTGWHGGYCVIRAANSAAILPIGVPLYTAPQRKPLTEEEIQDCFHAARNAKLGASKDNSKHRLSVVEIARAIERAHGIGGQDD